MKKILFIIVLINVFFVIKAQDYYAKDLPEYTAVADDSTDVFYIDDSGIDKHIEMPTLIQLVSDSTNQLRSEVDTAKTNIRSEIAGGGAFSATGDMIDLTSADDSLYIGDGSATEKFEVNGNAKADTLISTVLQLPSTYIYESSGITTFSGNTDVATAKRLNVKGYLNLQSTSSTYGANFNSPDGLGMLQGNIYLAGSSGKLYFGSTSSASSIYDDASTGEIKFYNAKNATIYGISDLVGGAATDSSFRTMAVDTIAPNEGSNIVLYYDDSTDSLIISAFADAQNPTILVVTDNGAIDTGYFPAADFAFELKQVMSAVERMEEMQDNEIAWYWTSDSLEILPDGDTIIHRTIHKTFGLHNVPGSLSKFQAMVTAIEMGVINTADLERRIIELEKIKKQNNSTKIKGLQIQLYIVYAILLILIFIGVWAYFKNKYLIAKGLK